MAMNLDKVTVIRLNQFECERLKEVKKSRSSAEYCWTCTPAIIDFCIDKFSLDHAIYIDADLQFFQNPKVLVDEVESADGSVMITRHDFYKDYVCFERSSGIYCVQFMYFRNDKHGREVLAWWKEACLKWCFQRHEDGKFGDQKYLDFWPYFFCGIHILQHKGGGVAPWNIQKYLLVNDSEKSELLLLDKSSENTFELVFYHFQGLQWVESNHVYLTSTYDLTNDVIELIYIPYIQHLKQAAKEVKKLNPELDCHGLTKLNEVQVNYVFRDKIYLIRKEFSRIVVQLCKLVSGQYLKKKIITKNLLKISGE